MLFEHHEVNVLRDILLVQKRELETRLQEPYVERKVSSLRISTMI
jgi:hypothetical protein